MPIPDAPDFQETVVTTDVAEADAPDFQSTVVAPGGGTIGGGYASLTGAGETATPGDLTQAGGFTVDDTIGHGISLTENGVGTPAITIANNTGGAIDLTTTGIGGINLHAQFDNQINITANGGINFNDNGGGGFAFDDSPIGFFGVAPHTQVATPVTLADVIALLQAYGLSA